MKTILFYNGKGFISGVPATDLTEEDILKSGFTLNQLLAYGCYELFDNQIPTVTRVITINPADGISDEEAHNAGQILRQRRTEQEKK